MITRKIDDFESILKNVDNTKPTEEEIVKRTKKEYFRKLLILGWAYPEKDLFK